MNIALRAIRHLYDFFFNIGFCIINQSVINLGNFNITSKFLIPCENSTRKINQAIYFFNIPKFGKFWDVTDYHP
jgi:hypothetical protein